MSLIASTTVDPIAPHLAAIKEILVADLDEAAMGAALRDYCNEHLQGDELLFCEVHNRLSTDKIISKPNFRKLWQS